MKSADIITLKTPNTQLVLARTGDVWSFVHLGAHGGDPRDYAALAAARAFGSNHLSRAAAETYPAFGSPRGQPGCFLGNTQGGLQVRHADGDISVDWVCQGVEKPATNHVALTLADRAHPAFRAVQHFVAHADCDVFETWVELSHDEPSAVALSRMGSFCLEAAGLGERFHLLSLSGLWANEANAIEDELPRGREVTLGSRMGVHDSWENAPGFFLSVGDAPASEESGRVLAGALCWCGAWEIRFRHEWSHELRICAGAATPGGPYILEPGRALKLPAFVFSWSEQGKGPASRALHHWARGRMPHKGPRQIVLNSWEGIRFNVSEQKLISMMDGAKALGAECFVIDDGWFGRGDFARNEADRGLGDWFPDPAKLPNGLAPLAAAAKARGLALGLWFEPEMATMESELVRDHPDWVLHEEGRPIRRQRGGAQVLLDMANPAVRDALFERIDAVIRSIPGLAYIKWDANADIANPPNANTWFDYAAGVEELAARLRAAHPRIVFQACSSGGGRASLGALEWADEVWPSDNTCAQQRVFIQYGWSLFLPACALAAHVTAVPNKQTRRTASLKYRFDVAFTGRLGFELMPDALTPEEVDFARRCVADYKRLRPLVQGGDLYRLVTPREGAYAALLYVSPDRRRALVAVFGLSRSANDGRLAPLRLSGLDPALRYRIREINLPDPDRGHHTAFSGKTLGGSALATAGLPFDLGAGDDSFVLELTATRHA